MKRQTEYKYYGIQYIKQTEEKRPPPCTISIISKSMETIFVVLDNFGKCTVLNKNSKAKRVKRMRARKKHRKRKYLFILYISHRAYIAACLVLFMSFPFAPFSIDVSTGKCHHIYANFQIFFYFE